MFNDGLSLCVVSAVSIDIFGFMFYIYPASLYGFTPITLPILLFFLNVLFSSSGFKIVYSIYTF